MKNVFKKAHEITKKIIRKGDSYRETFRLALIFVHSEIKKGASKMVELKGTETQVKWANDIREELNNTIDVIKDAIISRKSSKNSEAVEKIEAIRSNLNNNLEAKFFIENFKSITKGDVFDKLFVLYNLEDLKIDGLKLYTALALKELNK